MCPKDAKLKQAVALKVATTYDKETFERFKKAYTDAWWTAGSQPDLKDRESRVRYALNAAAESCQKSDGHKDW